MKTVENKTTNIKATPAPLDLVDSEPNSTPLAVMESVVKSAAETIRKLSAQSGEPLAVAIPELILGTGERGGQTQVCTANTSLRRHTHKVSASGRFNDDGNIATISVSPFLAGDADDCIVYLLHAVAASVGMAAKGKPDMKHYSRKNNTFSACLAYLGLESCKDNDWKGTRAGIVEVEMSAATRKRYSARIARLAALNVNREDEVLVAPKANKRGLSIPVEFADVETMDAFLTAIGASIDEKTGELVKSDGSAWLLGKALAQVPAKVQAALQAVS